MKFNQPDTSCDQPVLIRAEPRYVAGVCSGLGRLFPFGPKLLRLAFVVTTWFSGAGVVAYIGLWIGLSTETGQGVIPVSRARRLTGTGLLLLAVILGNAGPHGFESVLAPALALLFMALALFNQRSSTSGLARSQPAGPAADVGGPLANLGLDLDLGVDFDWGSEAQPRPIGLEPTAPAAADLATWPFEPRSAEPEPDDPNPTEPNSTEPDLTEATPAEPDLTEATSAKPMGIEATPAEPDPTEPNPAEPTPAEPDPTVSERLETVRPHWAVPRTESETILTEPFDELGYTRSTSVADPEPPPPPVVALTLSALATLVGVVLVINAFSGAGVDVTTLTGIGLVVVGVGLCVSAFLGRSARLIPVVVLLIGVLAASPILDGLINHSVGSVDIAVTSADLLRPSYEHGIGSMRLDLTAIELTEDTVVNVNISTGRALILVPDGVELRASGTIDIGRLSIMDRFAEGVRPQLEVATTIAAGVDGTDATAQLPVLELILDGGYGAIDVR